MSRKIAVHIATIAALASMTSAQTLVRSVNGPAANAKYGKVCIRVPDQNADGYDDVLVGAPGFNQERGAIYCLSGAYLAFGTGTQTLWSLAPTANQGDLFGSAITDVGDVTGDNVHDFVVGQPGHDLTTSNDVGAVRLINGASHTAVSLISGFTTGCLFGSAVAACGDANGDGKSEVVIGGPGPNSFESRVYTLSGALLTSNGSIGSIVQSFYSASGADELGASIASGFDIDGDGLQEVVIGMPGYDGPGLTDSGSVTVFTPVANGQLTRGFYVSSINGERLGASVDGGGDYDGDGASDIVVGAPNSPNGSNYEAGRAVVLSGAKLFTQTLPYEIYTLPYGIPPTPPNHLTPNPNFHFGAAVRASPDLNNDGVGEILVGAPDYYSSTIQGINFRGLVRLFSGASGTPLTSITGASTDRLGDGLAGAIDDLDGDGFAEFVIAGSRSDLGGTDSGVLKCFRLFPNSPSIYCTGKINSLGCTPAMSYSGSPSASSLAPFLVTASNFINQKTGLLFYSHSAASTAFQGGFKCAKNPVRRTGALNSGGSASGSDCTGTYSLDFNARIASGVDPSLVAGAEIYAQYWSRDPNSASHTALSNALRLLINP